MTAQAWATLAVAVAALIQGLGLWTRVKIARDDLRTKKKQLTLDTEKYAYRKFLDRYNKVPVDEFEKEYTETP